MTDRRDPYTRLVAAIQSQLVHIRWPELADAYDAASAWMETDVTVGEALRRIGDGEWMPRGIEAQ